MHSILDNTSSNLITVATAYYKDYFFSFRVLIFHRRRSSRALVRCFIVCGMPRTRTHNITFACLWHSLLLEFDEFFFCLARGKSGLVGGFFCSFRSILTPIMRLLLVITYYMAIKRNRLNNNSLFVFSVWLMYASSLSSRSWLFAKYSVRRNVDCIENNNILF